MVRTAEHAHNRKNKYRFVPIVWIINLIKKQYAAKAIDTIQMDMLLKQVKK